MKPADVLIWERFIEKYPDAYETCQYDVEVGSPPDFDTIVNPETGGDAEALYKRKIDAVCVKNGNIDIIELKPNAGPSSVGQVKGYRTLYVRDLTPARTPRAVIITDKIRRDMPYIAEEEGVEMIAV